MEDYLRRVKTFLDAHPNEVLTIIIANKIKKPVMPMWKAVFDKSRGFALLNFPNFC